MFNIYTIFNSTNIQKKKVFIVIIMRAVQTISDFYVLFCTDWKNLLKDLHHYLLIKKEKNFKSVTILL